MTAVSSTSTATAHGTLTGVQPLLVSIKQAAQMLGISPWACYQLCQSGELPTGRIGKRILIRTADLEAFAERLVA